MPNSAQAAQRWSQNFHLENTRSIIKQPDKKECFPGILQNLIKLTTDIVLPVTPLNFPAPLPIVQPFTITPYHLKFAL